VGRTEVVRSSLHPVFSKVFTVDYYFEEVQRLRFEVYDTHGPSGFSCQEDDFLGGMECTLGQIVAQKKVTRPLLLKFGRNAGKSTITVRLAFNLLELATPCSFRRRGRDLFSKSDPFLELYRVNDDQGLQLVYRTEVVKNNLNPVWEPFKVSLSSLCSCEETRPLKVGDGTDQGGNEWVAWMRAGDGDTWAQGWEGPGAPKGQWGFHRVGQAGLKLLTSGDPLNSASQSAGITGVSHRARPLLCLVQHSAHPGETGAGVVLLTPSLCPQQYYILLILTDGVVTDMADTREAIVRASRLPMSIIIVGVGNADFTDMQVLDGDDGVLRSPRGEPALRDIVQFVPFRELKNASPAALAKCVLAEVPKQVVEYYSHRGLPPRGLGVPAREASPGCTP
uniref:C2 domain-containing protein n=1 Tax=Colobus angolensis palliatus TaxID=336983 RepID=A0A2K5K2Z1_COLAP